MSVTEQYQIRGVGATAIAGDIEDAVVAGRLRPGQRLPSVRALAQQLQVSPATVAAAYGRLRDRGIAVTEPRRAARVSPSPPVAAPGPAPVPAGLRDVASSNPDPELLPDLTVALRRLEVPPRLYDEPTNHGGLVALARERLHADGVDARHLTVTSGALDGIERVLQAHLRPGDRVAVEDPCWSGVLDLLRSLRLPPEPVAVDDRGPRPEALQAALAAGPQALILTPRAQNPTGAACDAGRAAELDEVLAAVPELLVVVDDHAAEIAGAPLVSPPTDRPRWAHVRSVAKTLGPDLRLAIAVGDATTIARVEGRQRHSMRWVSHILQRLVADLWQDPETPALLQRAAETYRARRRSLLEALAARSIPASGASGLNVWVPVPEETAVTQALWQAGWAVATGERFRLASPPGVRVTTAALSPADAEALADAFVAARRPASHSAPA